MKKANSRCSTFAAKGDWSCLDQIDAPQWADLSLERSLPMNSCSDDSWFDNVHPFHQIVSCDRRSLFGLHGGERLKLPLLSKFSSISVSRAGGDRPKEFCRGRNNIEPTNFKQNRPNTRPSRESRKLKKKQSTRHIDIQPISPRSDQLCKNDESKLALPVSSVSSNSYGSVTDKMELESSNKQLCTIRAPENEASISKSHSERQFGSTYSYQLMYHNSSELIQQKLNGSLALKGYAPRKVDIMEDLKTSLNPQPYLSANSLTLSTSSLVQHKMPIRKGLLHILKMSRLRESSVGLPQRVPVKKEQHIHKNKSYSSELNTGSVFLNKSSSSEYNTEAGFLDNRQKSACEPFNSPPQEIPAESKGRKMGKEIDYSVSCIPNNQKKSSIGSSQRGENIKGSKTEHNNSNHSIVLGKPRECSQPVASSSTKLRTSKALSGAARKKNNGIVSRQPLWQITNSLSSEQKRIVSQHQKVVGKENKSLKHSRQSNLTPGGGKKAIRNTATTSKQEEHVQGRKSRQEDLLHSLEDIQKWEKRHGKSYYRLSKSEKEKVIDEIRISKSHLKAYQ